ncbi:hypothetical protein SAMN05216388_101539 [Halorientalis persicus]|jgi:hypothetical protein|uniref:DUF7992 domain-containing protein n=1 Tax=Halorientalis persicus TaxID=1367881 RepID=A0A1H8R155_9EURY|nr:hypothetical protein [Halorientalis persicus]SEO59854.1 hypothetical protein SAMN05216388_101539 [Halorientalis persicus]
MGLDVDTPEPPELEAFDPNEYEDAEVVGDTDFRRDEIEDFLHDGAWDCAFGEWTDHTDLDTDDYDIVTDIGLIERFDFFWDSHADRVGYHAPGLPEDWKQHDLHPDLDSWGTVSSINAELTELGQIVCDVLKDDYIDWETDYEPPEDLPDF